VKIQDPEKQHPPFDIPAGAWQNYKSQGYHQVIEVTKPEPVVTVNWFAQKGRFIQDYECPPIIVFSTSDGVKGYVEGTKGTAHKTAKVNAGGRWHYCPEHIGEEYERLFAEWKAKSRKAPREQVSHYTPLHILDRQGVQVTPWQKAEYRKS